LTTAPLLTPDLLAEYEERLRSQGAPVDRWGRPGLSDDEMDATIASVGLRLPTEARVWWAWHDGGTDDEGRWAFLGPNGTDFLSLARAVETYRACRALALELVEPEIPELANVENRWNSNWFPIRGEQLPVVIDCGVTLGAPTPVRRIDFADVEGSPSVRAPSLGQAVLWWIAALDAGAWTWNRDRRAWDRHQELVSDDWAQGPLI
jgi:hypothetical protein